VLKHVLLTPNTILKLIVEGVYTFVLNQMTLLQEHFRIILQEIVQIDALLLQIIIQIIQLEDVFTIVHNILKPLQIIQQEDVFPFVQMILIYMEIIKL
jgi:hypothetical protein